MTKHYWRPDRGVGKKATGPPHRGPSAVSRPGERGVLTPCHSDQGVNTPLAGPVGRRQTARPASVST